MPQVKQCKILKKRRAVKMEPHLYQVVGRSVIEALKRELEPLDYELSTLRKTLKTL